MVVGREKKNEKSSWPGSVTQGQQQESSASGLFIRLISQNLILSTKLKGKLKRCQLNVESTFVVVKLKTLV